MVTQNQNKIINKIPVFDSQISLRGFGSFFVGGNVAEVTNAPVAKLEHENETMSWPQSGHFSVGQLYVQVFLSQLKKHAETILFMHGGGLTGAQWEMTPDGRQGWLQNALQDGFDVIVSDAAERGRAGVPHPSLVDGDPVFRSNEIAWEGFRIGPENGYHTCVEKRIAFEGQGFPYKNFDNFSQMFTARWPRFTPIIQASYNNLLKETAEKTLLIAHSEAGNYAMKAACQHPESLSGIVLVEPALAPELFKDCDLSKLPDIPVLILWGDFIEHSARWKTFLERSDKLFAQFDSQKITKISLPEKGITGNSHFPMHDQNSHTLWRLIVDWAAKNCT